MIEDREKEWQELESKARQMIDNPSFFPKDETTKQFLPTLHLWISSSFTPDKHWIFYNPRLQLNPQPKPRVKQLIWQKQEDFNRLNNPLIGLQEGFHTEPAFEIKTIEIDKEIFDKLHTNLAKIKVLPFVKDEILGLDGEHFGVETLGSYHNAKITWWTFYPQEWKELVEWYKKVRQFLEKEFYDR